MEKKKTGFLGDLGGEWGAGFWAGNYFGIFKIGDGSSWGLFKKKDGAAMPKSKISFLRYLPQKGGGGPGAFLQFNWGHFIGPSCSRFFLINNLFSPKSSK